MSRPNSASRKESSFHQLNERVKELQCLYSIAEVTQDEGLSLAEAMTRIVNRIPSAWQYPEIACARVTLNSSRFVSSGFAESPWYQAAGIHSRRHTIGILEVFYKEKSPAADEGPFLKEERSLIDGLARLIGQFIDRKQSEDDLRSLAAQLSIAEQQERLRIATDLHDDISQPLGMLSVLLGSLQQKLRMAGTQEEFEKIRTLLDHVIGAVRQLTFDLSPPVLYDLGLAAAVEQLVERMSTQHHISIEFEKDDDLPALPASLKVLLFTMTRELLWNVVKHSRASKGKVGIRNSDGVIMIEVEDNGVGFDVSAAEKERHQAHHFGLFSVRERIRHFGGTLSIDSRKGKGTRVWLAAPVENRETK